ncbi:hypothetical protein BC834DRAFT_502160 [Gloeopeniophorella convolvens]|nr:hypothetical protein BC834DRAFT_502160 [Gloeopeniophorella convolvens]
MCTTAGVMSLLVVLSYRSMSLSSSAPDGPKGCDYREVIMLHFHHVKQLGIGRGTSFRNHPPFLEQYSYLADINLSLGWPTEGRKKRPAAFVKSVVEALPLGETWRYLFGDEKDVEHVDVIGASALYLLRALADSQPDEGCSSSDSGPSRSCGRLAAGATTADMAATTTATENIATGRAVRTARTHPGLKKTIKVRWRHREEQTGPQVVTRGPVQKATVTMGQTQMHRR